MALKLNEKDPRVIKTRRLIQEAIFNLSKVKNFDAITVSDIAKKAEINRSTFYAHFQDKYDLLESIVSDQLEYFISKRNGDKLEITEEVIRNLILSICDYHEDLSQRCKNSYRSFASVIEIKAKVQLRQVMLTLFMKNENKFAHDKVKIELIFTMVSSAIYDGVQYWYSLGKKVNSIILVEEMLPFIMTYFTLL
ncbi:TetR/AcrR family transcriptional regulator [Clostridium chromiireducens]|uniref:TetR/AcrR family transcriptional regulator n=1 Tax=Clostridium chromiireducens TaxID=225345 RepID=UPI003AF7864E